MLKIIGISDLSDSNAYIKPLLKLHHDIFKTDATELLEGLKKHHGVKIFMALEGETLVGYKIGYEKKPGVFYSWLGGVRPDERRQGIASALMKSQHEWAKKCGYRAIRTHTKNKWRGMLILNLYHGFNIIGTYLDGDGEPKIILEKQLL
ncbi:GNAT family N-acetyltransferase [Camelliibacillus cellulosilyticus]|uniref:GNAT family N-acetyltransferase n=1 Tax=Camelliibacillus cellulosilyticus TaxID=2174486 RepID=A0ABV9GJL9_9BACL